MEVVAWAGVDEERGKIIRNELRTMCKGRKRKKGRGMRGGA